VQDALRNNRCVILWYWLFYYSPFSKIFQFYWVNNDTNYVKMMIKRNIYDVINIANCVQRWSSIIHMTLLILQRLTEYQYLSIYLCAINVYYNVLDFTIDDNCLWWNDQQLATYQTHLFVMQRSVFWLFHFYFCTLCNCVERSV
jgi:hypothetical protein